MPTLPTLPTLITSASNCISTGLAKWFADDASGAKQSLLAGAKELAMRGQAALADERIQTHVKTAQDVADSVTVWYTELEPGYLARFAQWASDTFAGLLESEYLARFAQWASDTFAGLLDWLKAFKLLIIWVSIVVIVHIFCLAVGFGRAGVVAGSLAAGFQAYAYGAFTPAGGVFAFLTSMGMLGMMNPIGLLVGMVLATIVVAICFVVGLR